MKRLSVALVVLVFALALFSALPLSASPASSNITTTYNFSASLASPSIIDFNTLDESFLKEFAIKATFRQRTGVNYHFSLYQLQTDSSWLLISDATYTGTDNSTDKVLWLPGYRESAPGSYELRFLTDSTHRTTGIISVTAIDFPAP